MNAANASYLNQEITDTVNNGINEFIFVLKRANYIIPDRATRSFPLNPEPCRSACLTTANPLNQGETMRQSLLCQTTTKRGSGEAAPGRKEPPTRKSATTRLAHNGRTRRGHRGRRRRPTTNRSTPAVPPPALAAASDQNAPASLVQAANQVGFHPTTEPGV